MRQYTKIAEQDGFDDVRRTYKPGYKNKNAKAIMKKTGKHRARQEGKKITNDDGWLEL